MLYYLNAIIMVINMVGDMGLYHRDAARHVLLFLLQIVDV